jgi:prepilin-type processing-associated H-X9-DG protein
MKPVQITRPAEIILVADATQQSSGQSHTNFYRISHAFNGGYAENANLPINTYADPDPDNTSGAVFRYRHEGKTNAAFVDGYVGSFKRGEVLQKNVCVNY